MKRKSAAVLLALLFTAGVFAGCGGNQGTGQNSLQILQADNTVKIMQDEPVDSLRQGGFDIEAASGESEGSQVIVRPEKNVRSFTVVTRDLYCETGRSIRQEHMTLYFQYYTEVRSSLKFPTGMYPDALIPLEYIEKSGENTIAAGENQGLWLTIDIPAGCEAGTYRSFFTLIADGETYDIDVTCTVWDFSLPEASNYKTCFLIWRDWLIDGELSSTMETYQAYYDFLLSYRISGYESPAELYDVDAYIQQVVAYYDRSSIYYIPYILEGNEIDYDLMKQFIKGLALISTNARNYLEKAYYYVHTLLDEADQIEANYANIEIIIPKIDALEEEVVRELTAEGFFTADTIKVKDSITGIRHVMTTQYMEEYDDILNTFCPPYTVFTSTDSINTYRRLQEEGNEIWSYGAILEKNPYPSFHIDDNLISARDIAWMQYDYGLEGSLYWNVNGYVSWWELNVGSQYGRLKDFYSQASHDGISNGDGYLLYPGKMYGSDKPFPSLRLEAIRDGIDDYDYMAVLNERYQDLNYRYAGSFDAQNVIRFNAQDLYSLGTSKVRPEGLKQSRRNLASLIVAADKAKFAVTDLEKQNDGISYRFFAGDGWTISVGGVALTGTASGGGICYEGTTAYTAAGIMTVSVENNGQVYEMTFTTHQQPSLLNGVESQADADAFTVSADGVLTLNQNEDYALSGNSLRVELSGKLFDNPVHQATFIPYVEFPAGDVQSTDSVQLMVYNPGQAVTLNVFARDSVSSYVLDTVTLPSGRWTKITVDNFQLIESRLSGITALGLQATENMIANGTAYKHVLYIDEVYAAKKGGVL